MKCSEDIKDIAAALAKAQAAIEGAVKDAENDHLKKKYATLDSVINACREALTANSISVIQPLTQSEGRMSIVTRLLHPSGQWMEDDGVPLLLGKNDMQGLGSAITYARRFGLMAMAGVAPEDDDGEGATEGSTEKQLSPTVKRGEKKPPEQKPAPSLTDQYKALIEDLGKCVSVQGLANLWTIQTGTLAKFKEHDPELYEMAVKEKDRLKTALQQKEAA